MVKHYSKRQSPIYEELEPRLLFSADVAEALAANAVEQDFDEEPIIIADLEAEAETSVITVDQPVQEDTVSTDPQAGEEVVADVGETEQETSVQTTDETATDTALEQNPAGEISIVTESETTTGEKSTEDELSATEVSNQLVLVNDNVHEYELLVEDLLQSNGDDSTIEVVILDSEQDGIEQISALLSERSDINAIHIITHGSDGQFALGSDWLNNDDLLANSEAISSWSNALSDEADILLYGCNIAIDNDGQLLTDTLAELTGADVAASDDKTGHKDLGGDWELEYVTGHIEAEVAVSQELQQNYEEVLALPVITMTGPAVNYTENDPATIIDATATVSDGDSLDFNTGTMSISFSSGGTVNDELSIIEDAVLSIDGTTIKVNGKNVASHFSGGTDGIPLVITWSSFSTPANVQVVLQHIAYHNTSAVPSTTPRTIDFVTTDGDGDTSNTAQQMVNVISVPGAPTLVNISPGSIVENTDTTGGISVGTLSSTDTDSSAPFTYALVGGADVAVFNIGGAGSDELILTDGVLDHEIKASYVAIVRSTDDTGLSFDQELTITVTDVNEFDPITADTTFKVDENVANGTSVGTVAASDADSSQTLSYAITAGNVSGAFTINATSGEITIADGSQLDYETTTEYILTVQVTDSVATTRSDTATITINVNDVNEAPTISLSNITATLAEDTETTAAIKVADITITDDTLGTNNLSLTGADAGMFTIVGSELFLNAGVSLDFETNASLDVTVQVDDPVMPATPEDSASMVISIMDINEVPVLGAIDNQVIDETETLIFTATATDSDVPADTLTFSLDAASLAAGMTITAGGDFSWTPTESQGGSTPSVTITVTDSGVGNLTDSETFTITVIETNVWIGATSDTNAAENSVVENVMTGTTVGITSLATDPDEIDTVTYFLSNDAGGLFAIDANTGVITVSGTLDYETATSHMLTVQSRSTDGSFSEIDLIIQIGDIDESSPVDNSDNDTEVTNDAETVQTDPNVDDNTDTTDITDPGDNDNTTISVEPVVEDTQYLEIDEDKESDYTSDIPVTDLKTDTREKEDSSDEETQNEDEVIVAVNTEDTIEGINVSYQDSMLITSEDQPYIQLAPQEKPSTNNVRQVNIGKNDVPLLKVARIALKETFDFIAPLVSASPIYLESPDPGRFIMENEAMRTQLDAMLQDMDQAFDDSEEEHKIVVYMAEGVSASLAVGVASYLLRAGSLMSSFLTTVPLWRGFDPVAILVAPKKKKKKDPKNLPKDVNQPDINTDQRVENMFDQKVTQ